MTKTEKAMEIVQGKIDKNLVRIENLKKWNRQLENNTGLHNQQQMKKMTIYLYNKALGQIKSNAKRIQVLYAENKAYKKVLSVFVALSANEDYE